MIAPPSDVQRLTAFVATGLLALLLLPSPAAAQYQWRDAQGKMVFSDQPPPASIDRSQVLREPDPARTAAARAATAAQPPATSTERPPASLADRDMAFRKRQMEQQEAARKLAAEQAKAQEKKTACADNRDTIRTLESGMRVSRVDANGERSFLSDAERNERLRTARRNASSGCSGSTSAWRQAAAAPLPRLIDAREPGRPGVGHDRRQQFDAISLRQHIIEPGPSTMAGQAEFSRLDSGQPSRLATAMQQLPDRRTRLDPMCRMHEDRRAGHRFGGGGDVAPDQLDGQRGHSRPILARQILCRLIPGRHEAVGSRPSRPRACRSPARLTKASTIDWAIGLKTGPSSLAISPDFIS